MTQRSPVQRITRDEALVYGLNASLLPALRVESGEVFAIETEDASSGLLTSADILPTPENLPYTRDTPARANPVGGPIFVEGVEAGQIIKIEIIAINLAPSGVTYNRPSLSPLGDSREWSAAAEPFAIRIEHRDGRALISERLCWDLAPMVGTLACAPQWEVRSSAIGQGPWGGNLDVLDFRAGATVYLNAYHRGGLLFVGDVHGCQGDGEYFGVADESQAEVILRVYPFDGDHLPAPRVETEDRIVALWMDKPLEAAARGAIRHLMSWLVTDFEFTQQEAYLLVGLNPEFRLHIYQMTAIRDLLYTVGASLPRKYLS